MKNITFCYYTKPSIENRMRCPKKVSSTEKDDTVFVMASRQTKEERGEYNLVINSPLQIQEQFWYILMWKNSKALVTANEEGCIIT